MIVSVVVILAFSRGIHPHTAYFELVKIVGQLSIFDPSRRPPEIPRYDHDDLGTLPADAAPHRDPRGRVRRGLQRAIARDEHTARIHVLRHRTIMDIPARRDLRRKKTKKPLDRSLARCIAA